MSFAWNDNESEGSQKESENLVSHIALNASLISRTKYFLHKSVVATTTETNCCKNSLIKSPND